MNYRKNDTYTTVISCWRSDHVTGLKAKVHRRAKQLKIFTTFEISESDGGHRVGTDCHIPKKLPILTCEV